MEHETLIKCGEEDQGESSLGGTSKLGSGVNYTRLWFTYQTVWVAATSNNRRRKKNQGTQAIYHLSLLIFNASTNTLKKNMNTIYFHFMLHNIMPQQRLPVLGQET